MEVDGCNIYLTMRLLLTAKYDGYVVITLLNHSNLVNFIQYPDTQSQLEKLEWLLVQKLLSIDITYFFTEGLRQKMLM